jgi:lipid II:glycine glycyltransferase (peptidoglycan interpeptide bridge formation enzyme)
VEAGIVLFRTAGVSHAQYTAASELAYEASALDAVFDASITEAAAQGARWFDFGVSTEQGGRMLNEGLHQFKSEFGGGGIVYEFYELALG